MGPREHGRSPALGEAPLTAYTSANARVAGVSLAAGKSGRLAIPAAGPYWLLLSTGGGAPKAAVSGLLELYSFVVSISDSLKPTRNTSAMYLRLTVS